MSRMVTSIFPTRAWRATSASMPRAQRFPSPVFFSGGRSISERELFLRFLGGGFFLVLTDDGSDGLQFVAGIEIDEFDAHRVAASFADIFDACSHHLPADGDEHDFVRVT